MKKTIFILVHQLCYGGQERFVSHLSEMLKDRYDIYIVLFDDSNINYKVHGSILNINVNILSRNPLKKATQIMIRCVRLRKYVKKYKPVSVLSFGVGANLTNLLCKMRNTKTITSIRGYATAERMSKKYIDKMLYKRSDYIVCVSEMIRYKLEQDIPCLKDKLVTIYNGYDCDNIFQQSQETIPESISTKNRPKLISVGTLKKEKGYWHLIKVVSVLKKRFSNIELHILGENSGNNKEIIEKLASALGVTENVVWDGWNQNPYAFISNADVYILSSVREGFPNALVEAMACKKPVIASDCLSGPREILSNEFTDRVATDVEFADYGILTPRYDEKEDYSTNIDEKEIIMANAIERLLTDTKIAASYSQLAYERSQDFSYEVCSNKYIDLIEK